MFMASTLFVIYIHLKYKYDSFRRCCVYFSTETAYLFVPLDFLASNRFQSPYYLSAVNKYKLNK